MTYPAVAFFDLHTNKYNQFSEHHDRLNDCLKVIDDVFKLAAKSGASTILFGGDLGDLPRYIYIEVIDDLMLRFAKWFKKYPTITLYSISGNHDQNKKNYWDKPAKTLLSVFATAFPDRFILIDNKLAEIAENIFVAGIPYYEHKSCFNKALDEMYNCCLFPNQPEVKVTLLIHQTPEGIYNKHIRCETNPSDVRYEVFDLVMCGHIHKPQRITDKFQVGGNPLHRDLGDCGDDKGIWLLDLANPAESLEFISRAGRYPAIIRMRQSEITEEAKLTAFIIPVMDRQSVVVEGSASVDEFAASMPTKELLKNFWLVSNGQDDKLLSVGLSLIE